MNFWLHVSPSKEMGEIMMTRGKENILDLTGNQTHNLWIWSTIQFYQLSYEARQLDGNQTDWPPDLVNHSPTHWTMKPVSWMACWEIMIASQVYWYLICFIIVIKKDKIYRAAFSPPATLKSTPTALHANVLNLTTWGTLQGKLKTYLSVLML